MRVHWKRRQSKDYDVAKHGHIGERAVEVWFGGRPKRDLEEGRKGVQALTKVPNALPTMTPEAREQRRHGVVASQDRPMNLYNHHRTEIASNVAWATKNGAILKRRIKMK